LYGILDGEKMKPSNSKDRE